jgi:hypothetical protein
MKSRAELYEYDARECIRDAALTADPRVARLRAHEYSTH